MKNLCLVLDIDETILHYDPKNKQRRTKQEPKYIYDNDGELAEIYGLIYGDDELFFRPGFWKFIKYVKSQNGDSLKRSESSDKESEDLRSDRDSDSPRRDDSPRRKGSDAILLGIWTFGTRGYLNALRPYLGDSFAFFHTIEEMKRGMLDKQLDYVIEKTTCHLIDHCRFHQTCFWLTIVPKTYITKSIEIMVFWLNLLSETIQKIRCFKIYNTSVIHY